MDGRLILVVLVACFVVEITETGVDRKQQGERLNAGLWNSSVVIWLVCRIYKTKIEKMYTKETAQKYRDVAPPSFISYKENESIDNIFVYLEHSQKSI